MSNPAARIASCLEILYPGHGESLSAQLMETVERRFPGLAQQGSPGGDGGAVRFSARDAILIAYPDMLRTPELRPLGALADFAGRRLAGLVSMLHILPFFPSSSDEGFSIKDYRAVEPSFGSWDDLAGMGRQFGLAVDLVLNHSSAAGEWFRSFLQGRPPWDGYFITRPEGYDATQVFRPRTHPLLTGFVREDGSKLRVWTTFSADQVDLDYSNPRLLLEMIDVFLLYLRQGARVLRLDAIAYVWKKDGTSCVDLPQAHTIVKLLRAILDLVEPEASLLSETNLPHEANVSYFGSGDEAHLVYNFALPPLVLHACVAQRADYLAAWAARLPRPREDRSFVNFLASHDGIGVTPARGLLPEEEIRRLVGAVTERGGLVSSRSTAQGQVPYEINSTFLDAVADPAAPREERLSIFLASHAAMLALSGVPAIYFHSLVGSENWREGPALTGSARSISRERLALGDLDRELDDPATFRHAVFQGLARLLRERAARVAFNPGAAQRVLEPDGSGRFLASGPEEKPDAARSPGAVSRGPIFGLLRGTGPQAVLALVNFSSGPATCAMPRAFRPSTIGREVVLPPWASVWIDGSCEGA